VYAQVGLKARQRVRGRSKRYLFIKRKRVGSKPRDAKGLVLRDRSDGKEEIISEGEETLRKSTKRKIEEPLLTLKSLTKRGAQTKDTPRKFRASGKEEFRQGKGGRLVGRRTSLTLLERQSKAARLVKKSSRVASSKVFADS